VILLVYVVLIIMKSASLFIVIVSSGLRGTAAVAVTADICAAQIKFFLCFFFHFFQGLLSFFFLGIFLLPINIVGHDDILKFRQVGKSWKGLDTHSKKWTDINMEQRKMEKGTKKNKVHMFKKIIVNNNKNVIYSDCMYRTWRIQNE